MPELTEHMTPEEVRDYIYRHPTPFGTCQRCGEALKAVWFIQKEYKYTQGQPIPTGRTKEAVSHLECPCCGREYPVDETFDGPWEN